MADWFADLYAVVEQRFRHREEGSYTAYLFDAGLDKILKKLGEETTETIIAAKNLDAACEQSGAPAAEETREALVEEVCDLLYHLTVMLYSSGLKPEDIEEVLHERMQKTGNLKQSRQTDKNT